MECLREYLKKNLKKKKEDKPEEKKEEIKNNSNDYEIKKYIQEDYDKNSFCSNNI